MNTPSMRDEASQTAAAGDFLHVTRDEEYIRQAQAEAEYWAQPQIFSLDIDLPPAVDEYFNEQLTGDRHVAWHETIPQYGSFRRGCALGLGGLKRESRILEQNPSLHLTILDISEAALSRRRQELNALYPGRVTSAIADLNFVELAPDSYDLILSDSCLHHVLNLEHVAFQVDKALAPDGYFFLNDYVGESRFQYAGEKKRYFEAAVDRARPRHPTVRGQHPAWPRLDGWEERFSPFEAVRSEETLAIVRRYLTEVSVRYAGVLIPLLLWLRPVDGTAPPSGLRRRLRRLALRLTGGSSIATTAGGLSMIEELGPDLIQDDRELSRSGRFRPNIGFAIYRKRPAAGG